MNLGLYLIIIALIIFIYIIFWFGYSLRKKRNDVADEAWGLAQPTIATAATIISGNYNLISFVLIFVTAVWGLRLYFYLVNRHHKSSEDRRYIEMRNSWGDQIFVKSFVYVFLIQGFFMFLVSLSVILAIWYSQFNFAALVLGLLIWVAGFVVEVVANRHHCHHNLPRSKFLATTRSWLCSIPKTENKRFFYKNIKP